MAQRQGKRNEYVVDGMFDIPSNVDEFVYDENLPETDDGTYTIVPGDGESAIVTPEILRIISQDLRLAENGSQVVDVIVEINDIPGITKYEFRVTKI